MSGCFFVARRIFESAIWRRDPLYLKLFLWIIGRANYMPIEKDGFKYRRGELITTYAELQRAAIYFHNNRIEMPSIKKIRVILSWLAAQGIIRVNPLRAGIYRTGADTGADPGADPGAYIGIRIFVVNYETYQNLDCYSGRPLGQGALSELGRDIEISNKERARYTSVSQLSQIAIQFNELLCPPLSSVRISADGQLMSKSLVEQLNARCSSSELQTIQWWISFFQSIKLMPFLLGDNNNGWQATLHWITKRANFEKILDGNYLNHKTRGSPNRRQTLRDDLHRQAEYLKAIDKETQNHEQRQEESSNQGHHHRPDALEPGQRLPKAIN